jgi:hypothetical protein
LQKEQLRRLQKEKGEIIKLRLPEPFDGSPAIQEKYITEVKTYFRYFNVTLKDKDDKVLFAGGCLTSAAAKWFRLFLKDWNNCKAWTELQEETQYVFEKYENFKE